MNPILMNLPMPITTDRILIRPPQIGEGEILNNAILETYDSLKATMPWAQIIPSVEESEEFARQSAANWILRNNEEPYLPLFIFDKLNNQFLGGSGYAHFNWEVPSMEIGYWLREKKQGQGIMTEAINAVTQYAFSIFNLQRLEIRCDVQNAPSKKVPERLGFHLEATLKNHRINPATKQISDTLIYVRHNQTNLPTLNVTWPGRSF